MGEFGGVFRVFWTFDWSRPFLSKKTTNFSHFTPKFHFPKNQIQQITKLSLYHRQSSGSDPLSPNKPGVSRELNFTAINPPKHQSTPLRENTNGKNNSNRKNGRKSKKNKRTANRRPSEVVAKNQAENSSEEETEEYEVFIAVPEKRTAELIGKQGSHLKKYAGGW